MKEHARMIKTNVVNLKKGGKIEIERYYEPGEEHPFTVYLRTVDTDSLVYSTDIKKMVENGILMCYTEGRLMLV